MNAGVMPRGDFLERAQATIQRRTGLVFSEARRPDFERGLRVAMERAAANDPPAYLARLDAEPGALDDLVAEITVGETYFFREPEQFAVIREQILPELMAHRAPTDPIRIWSAGCASGEEPYSMAILLREMGYDGPARILGTDLSRGALARARRGRYTRWSFRGVSKRIMESHFPQSGREFTLAAAIREAVDFGYLNLAEDAYPSLATGVWGMDLILCRNVLIYFDAKTIAHVAQRLLDSLAEGGWLLLGASDPLLGHVVPCEVMVTRAGLAYRRARHRENSFPPRSPPLDHTPPWGSTGSPPVLQPDVPTAAAPASAAQPQDRAREAVLHVRTLANHGDLAAAGRACAAALDRHRTSAELAYLHAVLLAEAGRPADSATAARTAIYLDRHLVVAHLALGAALTKLGDVAGAGRSFRNAARLLAALPADAPVPAADGESAARLAEMVRLRLRLLAETECS
jgi:chemotaxis protein methyltransferase CheR